MDVATIYAARTLPREPLSQVIVDIISKLKISFKPPFRKHFHKKQREPDNENWRQSVLSDVVRKVREKDDPDYDEITSMINKLSKSNFIKLMSDILGRLEKRDGMFRLRVTTLLFDRGLRQNFFAPIMADAYAEIAKAYPDALQDLLTLVNMFDTLYDASKVILVPPSTDPGYDEAIIAWTKQKEMKRGFAVYVSELYARKLIPEDIIQRMVQTITKDLVESVSQPKTSSNEEHVDALVRFIFAGASKIPTLKNSASEVLALPRESAPSLSMKSRFKLEDSLKQ
jgi:hypothetical protein